MQEALGVIFLGVEILMPCVAPFHELPHRFKSTGHSRRTHLERIFMFGHKIQSTNSIYFKLKLTPLAAVKNDDQLRQQGKKETKVP